MRAIFISLVLINAIVAVYYITKPIEPNSLSDHDSQLSQRYSQGLARLTLLSEQLSIEPPPAIVANKSNASADVSGIPDAPKLSIANIERNNCLLLGPYGSIMNARHARTRANRLKLDANVKRIKVPANVPVEHWVHIPPQTDRKTAMTILKRLQSQSIDSYLMTRGDNNNAISLGLFRNYDSARRLLRKIAVFGYPVEIQVMRKYKQEYWLELDADTAIDEATKQKIQSRDQQTQWQQSSCDEVAS